jgi:hypothetical protein
MAQFKSLNDLVRHSVWREIQSRKACSTGTLISVTFEPGEDPQARWQTTCVDHGECVGHETRKLAVSWASEPEGWCSACAVTVARKES